VWTCRISAIVVINFIYYPFSFDVCDVKDEDVKIYVLHMSIGDGNFSIMYGYVLLNWRIYISRNPSFE